MLCLPTVHLKAFIMADNYVCDVCLFECTSHENMQDHIRAVHIAVKTFECDQCDHFLLTEKRLNIHMRMVHSKKEKNVSFVIMKQCQVLALEGMPGLFTKVKMN